MSILLAFDPSFRRALFDLVMQTACVDPMMNDSHIDAVRGVQVALGLVDEAESTGACRSVLASCRELVRADERERSIAYAAVVWLALADGVIDDAEEGVLRDVRRALHLSDPAVALAELLARRALLAAKSEGLPAHRSFARLVIEAARHDARRALLRAA